ncbi:MAG: hypothetical protein NC400_03695 [Clostridium sp.]|nr:hypothetical protein [Clostridium sp.]
MGPGIVGIIVFIVIINVYHIIKNKKRKQRNANVVEAFQTNYRKKKDAKPKETEEYVKYITKYNSSVDFIDKDAFVEEAAKDAAKTSYKL